VVQFPAVLEFQFLFSQTPKFFGQSVVFLIISALKHLSLAGSH
jgi:hypothetical protein